MKKKLRLIFVITTLLSSIGYAQCTFTTTITPNTPTSICAGDSVNLILNKKNNFGGLGRENAVGFSIGNKGYVGTGYIAFNNYATDFWQYDATTDSWTQKANFAGTPRYAACGFSIGSKGYIGTGHDNSPNTNDFWEYDTTANAWTQKTSFPGTGRMAATGFSIGTKGYIGLGYDGSYKKDFWEYDQATDSWTQKANFSGTARGFASSFVLGTKGYVGTGYDVNFLYTKDFWELDPTANTWTQKANFGGGVWSYAVGFSIAGKGYFATGQYHSNVVWEYNLSSNTWTQKNSFGGVPRNSAVAFTIVNNAYIGTGTDASGNMLNDFWQYDPTITYHWSNNDTTQVIHALTAGVYTVTVKNGSGCTATASETVTVFPKPNVNISGYFNPICASNTITLTANGANTYTWSTNDIATSINPSPTVTTNYTVTGTDGNNCINSSVLTVNVNPLPAINASSNTPCANQQALNLNSIVAPVGTYTYSWLGPNSYTASVQNPNIAIANVTTALIGTYTVLVTDANNCVNTSTVNVVINPQPIITATGATVCVGQTINLTSNGALNYSWNGANSFTSSQQSPSIPNADSAMTGTYLVFGTDANGCYNAASTQVVVSICSGIEKETNNMQLNIYPNPNNGNFTIETTSLEKQTLQLFDVNGRLVHTQLMTGKININLTNLSNGFYTVKLIGSYGIANKSIVIAN